MAAMMQSPKYGPEFFQKLRENGVELESGTTATHNRVADASYIVGICLDYVSANLIAEGSPMAFHYTTEDVITMTSPIALIKGCANESNGKLLMDFILSKEGQAVLVANNLVSVRDDVEMKVDTSAIAAINMEVDYNDLGENLQKYLDTFNKILDK
jgi:iron(III) transport system substrate-binding protein